MACNPQAEQLFGLNLAALRQRNCFSGWTWLRGDRSAVPEAELPVVRARRDGQSFRDLLAGAVSPSGERRWRMVNAEPVRGAPTGVMSAVVLSRSDITERHPNEALLPKLSRAVEQSPLATVISNTAGEIKCFTEATTRLTGFGRDEALGLARTALQPAHRPTALAALAALATSLQQAQALTDSSPHVVLQPGCARVVDRAQAKGPSRPLQADDLPDALRGDPTRLRQALLNLLSNAVKFTDRGSIVVQVERLAPRGEGAQGLEARAPPPAVPGGRIGLRFRVQDTGIGLASGQLDTLLPVLSQADSATNRRCGGTGLGLSVTRRLAAMMGGGWACRWTWPTTALTRGLACSASPMT